MSGTGGYFRFIRRNVLIHLVWAMALWVFIVALAPVYGIAVAGDPFYAFEEGYGVLLFAFPLFIAYAFVIGAPINLVLVTVVWRLRGRIAAGRNRQLFAVLCAVVWIVVVCVQYLVVVLLATDDSQWLRTALYEGAACALAAAVFGVMLRWSPR